MQVDEQHPKKLSAITHSPYYGCTVRAVSKAHVAYEGVLDGISAEKDRIFLKNVHVNANLDDAPSRKQSTDALEKSSTSDTLNAVMIDHLTTDIHIYEHVCLNVRDILELRLIQLPATFNESTAKLRAIDPCLVDIRLSPSDGSQTERAPRAPIARQKRGESLGSAGGENFADESNDDSIDEQIEKFSRLSAASTRPVTLLAKKVLPKKIERRTDASSSTDPTPDPHPAPDDATPTHESGNALKKSLASSSDRKGSPVRVTITSKLNPDAIPFYAQQRNLPAMHNPSFTFYERPRFRPRLPTVTSPDRTNTLPNGRNTTNTDSNQQPNSPQKLIPLRQMTGRKNFPQMNPPRTNAKPIRPTAPPPTAAKYRFHPSTSLSKRSYPQQPPPQPKPKLSSSLPTSVLSRQASLPTDHQSLLQLPIQPGPFPQRNNPMYRSTTSINSTASLPYHYGSSVDRGQRHTPISFGEPIGSHRNQRTFSMASTCSSASVDIGPHSIIQFDSSSPNVLSSFDEQYDFEKANEQFRRYLELEELVTRRTSPRCSVGSSSDINCTQPQSQASSYKREISFFDHISCTATTGTAVGYTEMDETEKNLETFGDDALLLASKSSDNEWQL